ncbi:MAG: hypothetical protein V9E87_12305 [Gemmatimonadales bacterium]
MIRRLALAATLVGAVPSFAAAQAAPATHDSVLAVVKGLFNGMRTRDTTLMRRSFAAGTVLGGVPDAGKPAELPHGRCLHRLDRQGAAGDAAR